MGKPHGVNGDGPPTRGIRVDEKASFSEANSATRSDLYYFDRFSYVCPEKWAKDRASTKNDDDDDEEEEEEEERVKSDTQKANEQQASSSTGGENGVEKLAKETDSKLSLEDGKKEIKKGDQGKEEGDDEEEGNYIYDPSVPSIVGLSPETADVLQRTVNAYALWNRWCTLPKKRFVAKIEATEGCPVAPDDADLLPWNFNKTMVNVLEVGDVLRKAAKYGVKANVSYA